MLLVSGNNHYSFVDERREKRKIFATQYSDAFWIIVYVRAHQSPIYIQIERG